MLLAMGFSGQKAFGWKLKYIQAFQPDGTGNKPWTYREKYGRIELSNKKRVQMVTTSPLSG